MVSLVQDTSSLEEQGLDNEQLNLLIEQTRDSILSMVKPICFFLFCTLLSKSNLVMT
jgi:hypothetical protein